MDSKRFIECVTDTLMAENERRIGTDKYLLDIAFLVAPIEQHINEPQYTDMLSVINEQYGMHYHRNTDEDDYGYNEVHFIDNANINRFVLTFTEDERMWGYCMCEAHNDSYNAKHRCCGNGCDWTAPAFSISKTENIGTGKWTGVARDYWRYAEDMNLCLADRNADVERERKDRNAEWLRSEIERCTQELNGLHV